MIAEATGLMEAVSSADLVVTGEGCFDSQSEMGKVVVCPAGRSVAVVTRAWGVCLLRKLLFLSTLHSLSWHLFVNEGACAPMGLLLMAKENCFEFALSTGHCDKDSRKMGQACGDFVWDEQVHGGNGTPFTRVSCTC